MKPAKEAYQSAFTILSNVLKKDGAKKSDSVLIFGNLVKRLKKKIDEIELNIKNGVFDSKKMEDCLSLAKRALILQEQITEMFPK